MVRRTGESKEAAGVEIDVGRSYDLGPDFAEQVLASVVCDPKFLARYRPALTSELFPLATQAFIAETVLTLFDKFRVPPSVEVVKDAIRCSVFRDRADAVMMVEAMSPLPDAEYVADKVINWCKWTAIDNTIASHPRQDPKSFAQGVDRASRTGDALTTEYVDLMDDGDVEAVTQRQIATPWAWLNQRMAGGPELQDFIVLLSFVNVGKTTTLVNIAGHAVGLGERVVYFTFEDGEVKIKRRVMQWIGGFTREEILSRYKEACVYRDTWTAETGGSLVIKRLKSRRSTVDDCVSFIRAQNEIGDRPVSVVITDYMDRFGVAGGSKGEPRHRLREVAEDCKYLAAELNVVHYSASQAQRGRAGKDIVSIEHVGESLGKIEGCDGALGLGQTMEDERVGRIKLFTAKLRDHKKHETCVLKFDADIQRVTELGV